MNRKKRNLIYIREKNNLNKGGVSYKSIKEREAVRSDGSLNIEYLKLIVSRELKSISSFYKIKLVAEKLQFGTVNDDFVKGLITIRFMYKKKSL